MLVLHSQTWGKSFYVPEYDTILHMQLISFIVGAGLAPALAVEHARIELVYSRDGACPVLDFEYPYL